MNESGTEVMRPMRLVQDQAVLDSAVDSHATNKFPWSVQLGSWTVVART